MKEDKLALPIEDMKSLGKALIDAAVGQRTSAAKQRVITQVRNIGEKRDVIQGAIKRLESEADFLDKQIAALQAGEFSYSESGIHFNDPELERFIG